MPAICAKGGTHDSVVFSQHPEQVDRRRAADREAEPPATHAERLAEGAGGDAVVEHSRLAQQRVVPDAPDHRVVRLVAEHRHVPAAHQAGETFEPPGTARTVAVRH